MAETRITNVIVPDIFTQYTLEPSIYRSRFFRSGAMAQNAALAMLLNGGGQTFQLPFWQDTAGTSGDIPIEGTDQTVNPVTAAKQIARRQFRTKAWGENDLASVLAGDSPVESAAQRVVDYWAQAFDIIGLKSLDGVIADNIDNDSGDLVNDVSGLAGALSNFSDDAVIDAQAKLGENGTLGRGDQTDFAAIVVHPSVYAFMRKQDLIDFVPISGQARPIEFYMNMEVIVTRNALLDTGVYTSYIMKPGALQIGVGCQRYEPTETDRLPLDGFGIDQLITRRVATIHPVGFAWQESSVAGTSPTDAELVLAANWDRVFAAENSGFVALKSKINQ